MKPKHIFCFYMSNGEHIMVEADDLIETSDSIRAACNGTEILIVSKAFLMALEQNR